MAKRSINLQKAKAKAKATATSEKMSGKVTLYPGALYFSGLVGMPANPGRTPKEIRVEFLRVGRDGSRTLTYQNVPEKSLASPSDLYSAVGAILRKSRAGF